MNDCLFCKIVAGQIPADIVYQDDDVVAFRDIHPQAPVHVLVVPRRHIVSFTDATEQDDDALGKVARATGTVAREQGIGESGFRVVVNNGPDAGQAVPHVHFHVLGGHPMGWPPWPRG